MPMHFLTECRNRRRKKINQLEDELRRKNQIIAVVTEEALELKKNLRDKTLQAFELTS